MVPGVIKPLLRLDACAALLDQEQPPQRGLQRLWDLNQGLPQELDTRILRGLPGRPENTIFNRSGRPELIVGLTCKATFVIDATHRRTS